MSPGVGPKCSQSDGLKGPMAELLVGNTLELVLGGTGGGGGPSFAEELKLVEIASCG